MILRKPYAFLIKHFKKIHIVLMILCAYIFYKHLQVYNFVKEYVELESYSAFLESIDKYTTLLSYLAILAVIIIGGLLLITLKRKEKPWKLYLVIILEYVLMLFVFIMTTNFFHTYDDTTAVTQILAIRDLLLLASFPQYLVFIILFIRITGLDLNKFSFQTDEEYLEMDSSDREEVEVSFEFDKHSVKRTYRRLKRNLGYFYLEHKFILNSVMTILFIIIVGYSYYYFGIVHKVYKEGQILRASDYEIKIKNAYVSDKDQKGQILDGDNYIILDLAVKNNGGIRMMNTDRFHLMNRNYDIVSTNMYDNDFKDLGIPYSKRDFQNGKTYDFLLIFKADNKLDINKFNLYYQEYNGSKTYLRKIKLKIEDLRTITSVPEIPLGKEQQLIINKKKKKLTLDEMAIGDKFSYNYYACPRTGCSNYSEEVVRTNGEKIIKINFTSLDFTGEELIDFLIDYGRINYKRNNGKTKTINVKNALTKKALNNSVYIVVPEEILASNDIKLELTIRNNRYTFKLR